MNKKFDYTAQIEKYLEGGMSGEEMKSFESSLLKDPALKAEFQLQKDIVSSLKEFRKAELKARLDQINVGSYSGGISTGLKIALTAALTASVGLGIYYFSNEEPVVENTTIEQVEEKAEPEFEEPSIAANTPAEKDETAEIIENKTDALQPSEEKDENVTNELKNLGEEEKSSEKEPINIVTPSVIDKFDDKAFDENIKEIEVPENKLENKVDSEGVSAVEIETDGDYKNTFHYKFYNSKLYLYGDFKNIPYEIIEFNTVSGKSLYLYYQGNFYYLELNQMEVTPLQKINEEQLIEELDSLRVKK